MIHPRVTLKQVAAKAGVHVSTAWRALKNDTYVDAAKRAKIRSVAKEMGYTPDPMLTALSHYRRRQNPPAYQSTFAWVNSFPERRACLEQENIRTFHAGAVEFAASMGFRLEEFWLKEPGMSAKRAREVLLTRGIRGLIFAPQPVAGATLALDIEPFTCVAIGYSLATPRMHVVCNHQHSSALLTLRQLCKLGHERIGMVSALETLRRCEHNFESPYYFYQSLQPETAVVPMFTIPGLNEPANINKAREGFLAWFRRYRPTAIIAHVSEVRGWLDAAGVRVPEDVSLATLSRSQDPDWSGIDQQEKLIGARTVELLISLFQSGERGAPATPMRMLVEGRWIEHETTRRIGPPAAELIERLA
ncbi:transcriptional regulator [Opitutaceae bacterium TAV1]|nr:LacI family transcriptional regulator [Opitutaceae bacterium TAV5]EIP97774.1 transcriptional regulator [Opitutaceae bacterium TAV1]